MPANRRNQIMFERYTEVVGSLPATMFAELSLHDSMKIRLHGARANTNFTGEKLWDRYNIVKKNIRTDYINFFPSNLGRLPSGTGLYDAIDGFIANKYKDSLVSAADFYLTLF